MVNNSRDDEEDFETESMDEKLSVPEKPEYGKQLGLLTEQYLKTKRKSLIFAMSILTVLLVLALEVLIWYHQPSLQKEVQNEGTVLSFFHVLPSICDLLFYPSAVLLEGSAQIQFIFGVVLIFFCLLLAIATFMDYIYIRGIAYLSAIVWVVCLTATMLNFATARFNMSIVTIVLLLALYIVLPLSIYWTAAGLLTIIIQAILVYHTMANQFSMSKQVLIIAMETLALSSVNIIGFTIKYMTERFFKDLFKETYNHLIARFELEEERQRQEQLLVSIIPADLAIQMRQSMVQRLSNESTLDLGCSTKRLWHDFHVREHKDVSILFADLVNFTQLTTKCSAKDLVNMLNEIYGRFDNLSRMNDCMRIKTLGDCYCCVSGMPVSRPNHAVSVVRTGLQMVKAIKLVRETTGSRLDMRIGVHSGNVLCGVLGLVKWKYDIWSEDVTYANFLESTGVPGKIHISKTTYLQCGDDFMVDLVDPPVLDSSGQSQETYLVRHIIVQPTERRSSFQRSRSINSTSSTQQLYTFLQSWGAPKPFEDLATSTTASAIPTRSFEMLEASVDSSFFTNNQCIDMCDNRQLQHFNVFTLRPKGKYTRQILDKAYRKMQEKACLPMAIVTFIFFLLTAVTNILLFYRSYIVFIMAGSGILYPAFIAYFTLKRSHKPNKKPSGVGYNLLMSYTIIVNIAFLALPHLIRDHFDEAKYPYNAANNTGLLYGAEHIAYTRVTDMLVIMPLFLFIFSSHLIKIAITALMTAAMIFTTFYIHFCEEEYLLKHVNPSTRMIGYVRTLPSVSIEPIALIFTFIILSLAARQTEYMIKSLTLWKMQYYVENEEVERMKNLTKLLLTNILPQHVASYYLNINGPNLNLDCDLEPYHESYDNVCIMFAAVMNFDDFFRLSSDNDTQHQCLRLLNEIIGDFDQLLTKPKYSGIEKMKTVGSTYMAAAGLQPGRDVDTKTEEKEPHNRDNSNMTEEQSVHAMTDFALNLFSALNNINKHSFNNFRLRIGMSHGPVIAGVVGAQKPQYDVWGDTVNMASRMESGGIVDRIQMTENTGKLLLTLGFNCICRGKTVVKGKTNLVTTYLLQPQRHTLSTISMRDQLSVSEGLNTMASSLVSGVSAIS